MAKNAIVQILESEGSMQSKINQAEGDKAEIILTSEAAKMDAINRATGAEIPFLQHILCPSGSSPQPASVGKMSGSYFVEALLGCTALLLKEG